MVVKDKLDDDIKLSKKEMERVGDFARRRRTQDIEVEDAKLIFECVGSTIIGLQPGGHDLSTVAMVPEVHTFVRAMRGVLSPSYSLRNMPEVDLAKLLSMRVTVNDAFVLAHFGYVLSRDFSGALTKMHTFRLRSRDVDSRSARRDLWTPIHTIDDLETCLSGLADAAEQMLHPTILDHAQVRLLSAQVRRAWHFHGGHTDVKKLKEAVEQRLSEHAENVGAYASDRQGSMPNLNEWGQLSKTLIDQAKNAGYILNLNDARVHLSQKYQETVAGKARQQKLGFNADGNEQTYSNPKERGTGVQDGDVPRNGGGRKNGRRTREEREKEKQRNMKCYNCTERGHSARIRSRSPRIGRRRKKSLLQRCRIRTYLKISLERKHAA